MSVIVRKVTADGAGAIWTGRVSIGTIALVAGTGAAAYVDLRDAIAGSGTTYLPEIRALQGDTSIIPLHGIEALNGIYVESITGAGAVLLIEIL